MDVDLVPCFQRCHIEVTAIRELTPEEHLRAPRNSWRFHLPLPWPIRALVRF